jgi:hypothetical protein
MELLASCHRVILLEEKGLETGFPVIGAITMQSLNFIESPGRTQRAAGAVIPS